MNSGVTDIGVRAAQHCTGHWDITQGTLMGRGEWVMTRGGGLIGTGPVSIEETQRGGAGQHPAVTLTFDRELCPPRGTHKLGDDITRPGCGRMTREQESGVKASQMAIRHHSWGATARGAGLPS